MANIFLSGIVERIVLDVGASFQIWKSLHFLWDRIYVRCTTHIVKDIMELENQMSLIPRSIENCQI